MSQLKVFESSSSSSSPMWNSFTKDDQGEQQRGEKRGKRSQEWQGGERTKGDERTKGTQGTKGSEGSKGTPVKAAGQEPEEQLQR